MRPARQPNQRSLLSLRRQSRLGVAAALLIAGAPTTLVAQGTPGRKQWVFGLGTFLRRDRGWNYAEGLELGAALERDLGTHVRLSLGATALRSLATGGDITLEDPPSPSGLDHAAALRLQARTRTRGVGLYALTGIEIVAGDAGNQGRGVRTAGSVGLGLSVRGAALSALEGQYVRFSQPFGTTRGVLSVRLVHRL